MADRTPYHRDALIWQELRELPATLAAWWDVHVRHPLPVLGDPIPIE
ncbi:MAG: hypothetical protein GX605_10655 [Chloroflexi bacterium]|nr:hypothetical protein [Chloroflexota bacterium]